MRTEETFPKTVTVLSCPVLQLNQHRRQKQHVQDHHHRIIQLNLPLQINALTPIPTPTPSVYHCSWFLLTDTDGVNMQKQLDQTLVLVDNLMTRINKLETQVFALTTQNNNQSTRIAELIDKGKCLYIYVCH